MPSSADFLEASGARIRLRALETIDVDTLFRWENDPAVWDAGSAHAPFSRRQLWDYVNSYDGDIFAARQLRLMIVRTDSDETIGTLDLFDFDPANSRCAVGIFITPEARGLGFAKEALRSAAYHLRRHLSIHQLYAIVGDDNTPSIALFRAAGFSDTAIIPDWIRRAGSYIPAHLFTLILKET
ncbi:MAG: GNAT family N-acetyltransferase [Duncaniella sp.]|nr:GNAT family N-acetyltransferase [Duncaniella sp.]